MTENMNWLLLLYICIVQCKVSEKDIYIYKRYSMCVCMCALLETIGWRHFSEDID